MLRKQTADMALDSPLSTTSSNPQNALTTRSLVKQRRHLMRLLARVLAATLLLCPVLAWAAAQALVVRPAGTVERADVIVMLSGSSAYVERTRHAAELFKQHRAARILLTNDGRRGGWSSIEQRNPFFVEHAARALQQDGVPAENIEILSGIVASTHDEAVLLRDYATMHNLRSILVVTSPYHSRRTRWMFRRALQATGVAFDVDTPPLGEQSPQSPSPLWWWAQARGWHTVAMEYPKFIYYWLRYS